MHFPTAGTCFTNGQVVTIWWVASAGKSALHLWVSLDAIAPQTARQFQIWRGASLALLTGSAWIARSKPEPLDLVISRKRAGELRSILKTPGQHASNCDVDCL